MNDKTTLTSDEYRLLTAEEISKLTGLTARRVRELINSGYFPMANVPGRPKRCFMCDVLAALSKARPSFNHKN